jgi:hypothetical protein
MLALLLAGARPTFATFPGESGHIAYVDRDPNSSSQTAVFVGDNGQITFPALGTAEQDTSPAYSPDGKVNQCISLLPVSARSDQKPIPWTPGE